MQLEGPPLVGVLAGTFGAITVLLVVVAAVATPVALAAATPFAVTTALLWYHASGRFTERVRRAAAREERQRRARAAATGPGGGRSRHAREERQRRRRRRRERRGRRRPEADGPDREEALDVLGLDSGASQREIRQAYRRRVKEVHPDRGGDEAAFRRVTDAYERLSD